MLATRDKIINNLEAQGYTLLGAGLYSEVYGKDGVDTVIKVSGTTYGPDAWLNYALWLLGTGENNPHFPCIKSLQVFPDFYVAEMERLAPLSASRNTRLHSQYKKVHSCLKNYGALENNSGRLPCALWRATNALVNKFPKAHWDLHDTNVMVRKDDDGETLVITDPMAASYRPYEQQQIAA